MSQKKPYILAVAGSPRRHGNSEAVLDAFAEGAKDAGATVEKLVIAERDIKPCRGCNACSLTGECVIRDEMQDVYPVLDEAASLVISSPVFFATVPAVLKAFYDRMQPYWARRYVLKDWTPEPRPGALMLVRGGGDPYGFQGAVWTTRSLFAVLGIEAVEELKLAGVDSPGDLGSYPEHVESVRKLGSRMAKEVSDS